MNRKFKITFVRFTTTPIFMGDFVSPAARSTVPKMVLAVRNNIGKYKIRKYCPAKSRIPSSTCIHTGICPDKATVITVTATPTTSTESNA